MRNQQNVCDPYVRSIVNPSADVFCESCVLCSAVERELLVTEGVNTVYSIGFQHLYLLNVKK